MRFKDYVFWYVTVILYCIVVSSVNKSSLMDFGFYITIRVLYTMIGIIDHERHVIPNLLLVCLLVCETLMLVFCDTKGRLIPALIGMSLVLLSCMLQYVVSVCTKSVDVIGAGDYKYLIVLGFCCGINGIIKVCCTTLILIVIRALIAVVKKESFGSVERVAIAPYLSCSAILFG